MEIYKKTKWLQFFITDRKPKTVVVGVYNRADQFLGEIRWHGPWRQYTWNTMGVDAQFNNGCLQDIADVLSDLNRGQHGRKNQEDPDQPRHL